MISNKSKIRRKHEKELNSLRNKMGSNIVWFDSLSKKDRYDILFQWKKEKYQNKLTKPEKVKVRKLVPTGYRMKYKWVEITKYPPNLKHFINLAKLRYRPSIVRVRETAIDLILKNK
jgi:hypothetical protein